MHASYHLLSLLTAALGVLAAYLALRLRPLSGARAGWTLLAAAMALQAVLRVLGLAAEAVPALAWTNDHHVRVLAAMAGAALLCAGAWRLAGDFRAARRTEALYRSVFAGAEDPSYVADAQGRILEANERATALLGYSSAELRSMHVSELAVPEERGDVAQRIEQIQRDGQARYERVQQTRDGRRIPCEICVRKVDVDGTTLFHAVARDQTGRLRAEAALRESEERYHALFTHISVGVYRSTPEGRIVMANPACRALLGLAEDADLASLDLEALARDGGYERRRFREAVERDGHVRGMEIEIRRPDGTRVLCRESARAVRDDAGNVLCYEGTVEDITERRRLEEQLRQSQKMEAIGQLAGGVAHDFNNLLTVITGHASLLEMRLPDGSSERDNVHEITEAAASATALTRQLLAFSRRQVLEPVVLDLSEVLAESESMLRRLIRENIVLDLQLARGLWPVLADRSQVVQVLLNLAVNARDAMPDAGRLTIATRNEAGPAPSDSARGDPVAGPHVVWSVSDTGVGMSAETLRHIFEPFFTTKGVGKGTGLGLSTVYGIVQQSRGTIAVRSVEGRGTTFEIRLPRCAVPEPDTPVPADPAGPAPAQRVLVAEDEDALRLLSERVLRDAGFDVLAAPNGEAALAAVQGREHELALLVTDMVMPGMGGRELATELRRRNPRLRVLFVSGYTQDRELRSGIFATGSSFLPKPFSPRTLVARVREMTDVPAPAGAPA